MGDMKDGKMHGFGIYTWVGGDQYVGQFADNLKEGQGAYTWVTGAYYSGEWHEGRADGLGTYTWPNGDSYAGEFRLDLKHGTGVYTWVCGDKHVGEYSGGKANGLGAYQWANGTIEGGLWVDGVCVPAGTSTGTPIVTTPIVWATSNVIESRIDGTFEGWSGDTVFVLENGQIWQQASYAYTYHYAYRPEVLIYRSGLVYKMKVDGVLGEITVKRLK